MIHEIDLTPDEAKELTKKASYRFDSLNNTVPYRVCLRMVLNENGYDYDEFVSYCENNLDLLDNEY